MLCWLRVWKKLPSYETELAEKKIKHHFLNIVGVFVFLAVCEGMWEQTDLICFSDLGKFMPCVLNYLKHFQGRASCLAGSVGSSSSPCPPWPSREWDKQVALCSGWIRAGVWRCSELLFHTQQKEKALFVKGWWALHCVHSVWSGSGRPELESCEGSPIT